jgi:serine O-acetyltransferase
MLRPGLDALLPDVAERLTRSIRQHPQTARLDTGYLPSRDVVCHCADQMLELCFPGYFGRQGLSDEALPFVIGNQAATLMANLFEPVRYCLRYREGREDCEETAKKCDAEAERLVGAFMDAMPGVRDQLATDVQAAFDGDPAATGTDEAIFSYPGLFAIAVQRLAHVFHKLDVPLLPRVMTEYAHGRTGIDIHPGAELGERMFIDHGTGVVIGETCQIGADVKIYQGVTLGALAPAFGQKLRGTKRHPTLGTGVTVYAGATILGGDTHIGDNCTIGGNVFLTESVPPRTTVTAEAPRLRYRERRKKSREVSLDFQI